MFEAITFEIVKILIMHFIKSLQRLLVSNSPDLKIVCNNNQVIHSHKILFGLLHVSLAEILMQDEFTDQTVTILLPIDSEDLKTALNSDCIEDSTNILNNIFKCSIDLDPDTSKQKDDTSRVELEDYDIEDFVSECINEPFDDVKFKDYLTKEKESMTTGTESIIEEKKIFKKVKLVDLLLKDDEDFSKTPQEHKIESVKNENSEKKDEKLQKIESLKSHGCQGVSHACDQCNFVAKYKSNLTAHIRSKHEGVKYACNQCDQQFTRKCHVTSHIQSKHEGVKYPCNQCGQQFTQQCHVTEHIKSKHEGVKYPCNQCNLQFKTQSNLRRHIRLLHWSIKSHIKSKHACDQCNFITKYKSHLTAHIQSKHGGVKYACNQCDQQFTRKCHVTSHIQSKHEGVKYPCNQCGQQFTQQCHVTEHIKSKHEGVRYPCNQCNLQYTTQSHLRRHIRSIHLSIKRFK